MFILINQKGPDGRPMLRLLAESGPLRGTMFRLEPPCVTVGNAPDIQISVPLAHISPRHFDIEIHADKILLRDLGSACGTIVNDKPVKEIALQHGDRITFGASQSQGSDCAHPSAQANTSSAARFHTPISTHTLAQTRITGVSAAQTHPPSQHLASSDMSDSHTLARMARSAPPMPHPAPPSTPIHRPAPHISHSARSDAPSSPAHRPTAQMPEKSYPAISAHHSPINNQEIFLAEQAIELDIDDVRTVLGSPLARWGGGKRPKTPLQPPPGLTQPDMVTPLPDWRQRKLEVLLAVSKALSRPEDLSAKIDRVLELIFDTMDIDRAAIMVLAPEDEQSQDKSPKKPRAELPDELDCMPQAETGSCLNIGEWQFAWSAFRNRQGSTTSLPISSTVINKVLRDTVAVMTQDAQAEDWLDDARSIFGQAIRTCICTPLKTANGILGVLYVDSSRTSHPFSREDMEFFTAFSNQAAVAIENSRLLRIALENERVQQDIRVARRIQRWLFPRENLQLDGYDLDGNSFAMDGVGGDYFDYIALDDNHIALVVADVSGHGISSALVMTMTRSILRGSLTSQLAPADILQRVNALVSEDMLSRMFVTMLLLILELPSGKFTYANAGHNPPLLYREQQKQITELPAKRGGPLGMSRWARLKPKYHNQHDILYPGDVLCLYTDGIPEATNPNGEEMQLQPLEHTILQHAQLDAKNIIQHIFTQLQQFQAGSPSTDDTTAIILKRNIL
jgi:serine phosphatase RsbU (regulator of sigma subunit)